jgi:hypothetical protein
MRFLDLFFHTIFKVWFLIYIYNMLQLTLVTFLVLSSHMCLDQ